jgi:hypothetical protein
LEIASEVRGRKKAQVISRKGRKGIQNLARSKQREFRGVFCALFASFA